jgi:hypothetical protein
LIAAAFVFRSPSFGQENATAVKHSHKLAACDTGTQGKMAGSIGVAFARSRNGSNLDEEYPMRKYVLSLLAAVSLGAAVPAMAYDSGGLLSMQDALGVATDIGLVTVSDTEFAGNEWQIEERDLSGQYMEVDVDATTGAVLNVDR